MAVDGFKNVLLSDEVSISYSCVKNGLEGLLGFRGVHTEHFVSLLLLSTGFERLMKLLLLCKYYDEHGDYPDEKAFNKMGLKTHDLIELKNKVILICEQYPLYKQASARIEEIETFTSSDDFIKLLTVLSEFSKQARYSNLDYAIEKDGTDYFNSPYQMLVSIRSEYASRYQRLQEYAMLPNNEKFYILIDRYWHCLLSDFTRFLSYCFTQGAFGSIARQISAWHVSDFLYFTMKHKDHKWE